MPAPEIFHQSVNGTVTFDHMPEGRRVLLQCNGTVTVSWWDDLAGAYNTGEAIADPGSAMDCPAQKVRFVTSGAVAVRVILYQEHR